MSASFAGFPTSFDPFTAIYQWDFEFRTCKKTHLPIPVALFVKEQRTGAEFGPYNREQLLKMKRAPFDTGPSSLSTSYSIVAELSCIMALGWPIPHNLMCSYFEICALVNGADIEGLEKKRPGLLEACELYELPHSSPAHKKYMRDLIMNNENYTEEQWTLIADYVKEDVIDAITLLEAIAHLIDVIALYRGRYGTPVAAIEETGIPISGQHVAAMVDNWQALRMFYIKRDDEFGLYDEKGSFKQDRFIALIESKGWQYGWPRTPSGHLSLKAKDIGKQAKRHKELKKLQHLRDTIAELRLGAMLNTIGTDNRSRCAIMPFWVKSGRNQPSGKDKVFLLSLPSWMHGIIAPPVGYGMALLDWKSQEPGIMAGVSGDKGLIADFANDLHMGFAIRSGLAPPGATKATHGEIRDMVKPLSLGVIYGMTKYGAAAQTGKSLTWAATALAAYKHAYPTLMEYLKDVTAQAVFDRRIVSFFGWPMEVHAGTKTRTLFNFTAQANGAECMRIAAIAAHEVGIMVCAPVHDAFWIMAPLDELDVKITQMAAIMERASHAVCGLTIPVEVAYVVKYPQCLGDVRGPKNKGYKMWLEIQELISSGKLKTGEAAE
jgi:DNA polymerase family A